MSRYYYNILNYAYEQDESLSYYVEFPDISNTKFSFSGLLTNFDISTAVGNVITCTVSIKISGRIIVTGEESSSS
jgi:hypothetical protein